MPRKKITYEEQRAYVIQTLRDFLNGTGGRWDWDDFISVSTGYQDLDTVREFCSRLPDDYPPAERSSWCGPDGLRELSQKLHELEAEDPSTSA